MQTSDWDKINLAMLNEIHSEDDQPGELVQTVKNNKIEAGAGWKSEDEVREYFNISHHDPYFIRKDSVENNFSCGDKNQSAIIRVHIVKPKSKSQIPSLSEKNKHKTCEQQATIAQCPCLNASPRAPDKAHQ